MSLRLKRSVETKPSLRRLTVYQTESVITVIYTRHSKKEQEDGRMMKQDQDDRRRSGRHLEIEETRCEGQTFDMSCLFMRSTTHQRLWSWALLPRFLATWQHRATFTGLVLGTRGADMMDKSIYGHPNIEATEENQQKRWRPSRNEHRPAVAPTQSRYRVDGCLSTKYLSPIPSTNPFRPLPIVYRSNYCLQRLTLIECTTLVGLAPVRPWPPVGDVTGHRSPAGVMAATDQHIPADFDKMIVLLVGRRDALVSCKSQDKKDRLHH
ncbi:hypothetical protein J6590_034084 [Homalodisca vitripennis]|nr:hypothetical protein J6590_034084 [Homalodisca vitripennis]